MDTRVIPLEHLSNANIDIVDNFLFADSWTADCGAACWFCGRVSAANHAITILQEFAVCCHLDDLDSSGTRSVLVSECELLID